MDWQTEFEKKIVSPDFAVSHVRSGDVIVMPAGRDPLALGLALAARKEELRDVTVFVRTPSRDRLVRSGLGRLLQCLDQLPSAGGCRCSRDESRRFVGRR